MNEVISRTKAQFLYIECGYRFTIHTNECSSFPCGIESQVTAFRTPSDRGAAIQEARKLKERYPHKMFYVVHCLSGQTVYTA